ncbi:ABC transporter substrate-binding protein [Megasphaera massiliensis]|uniref:ABC transporter substrate-binding protein n=1 Tax=Megasphaera massiliensis TaxID=1232428 RepID=UPI0003F92CC4|nr:ABC transporter substrate-binding protein [Megasphaera massiliensis]MBS6256773.1 ABC transporter substrate-binding protein [Megasphaera sp.]
MKKFGLCLLVLCLFLLAGCGPQGTSQEKASGENYAVITDDRGKSVTLPQKPQRVVVLSTSLLNFADALDGSLVGRAAIKSEDAALPEKYKDVPDVGPVYSVSLEKVTALEPDVVIGSTDHHEKLAAQLEDSGIPVILLRTKTYDDVKHNLDVMGRVYGKEEQAKAVDEKLDTEIKAITDAVPKQGLRIAIIHATPSAVSLELPTSIAGGIADLLHLQNIAAAPAGSENNRIPYSMESLVEANPDVIFLTSMGSSDKIEKRIKGDIESNRAWASLKAVQSGRFYILPERYFLLNPGLDYPKAVGYMANLVYPGVVPHE